MDDDNPQQNILELISEITVSPPGPEVIGALIVIFILFICSFLMSGSEVAFFSLSPTEKESLKPDHPADNLIISMLANPRRLLATLLVVNNSANVGIVILSTFVVNNCVNFHGNETLEFIMQVFVITFVLLLFGEVLPKVYATRNGISLARFMAFPLLLLSKIFYPLSFVLMNSTSLIEKRVKWKGQKLSSDDLHKAIALTSDDDLHNEDQKILEGIVRFGNTDVKQIMVSRVDVVSIDTKMKFDEVLSIIRSHRFTRIPVCEDNFDNIKGTLYIKDLLPYLSEDKNFDWAKMVRKPFFIPENKKLDDLLKEFQEKKIHLAIVVDEYGGASGIVTLDDVLSEVVGDISEEIRDDENYVRIDDNTYMFDGKIPLIDFYRVMNLNEEEFEKAKGESDTLAGFIIEISGRIPRKREKFEFGNCLFDIENADAKRILEIKVSLKDEIHK